MRVEARHGAGAPSGSRAVAAELVRLRRATESFRHLLNAAAGVDLDVGAMSVLMAVVRLGPQRPTELSRVMALDPSTTSRHLSSLIRKGYARRVPDPDDGRAHLVEATDAGRGMHAHIGAVRDRMLEELLRDWPPGEVDELARLMSRFNDTVDRVDLPALARRVADGTVPSVAATTRGTP